MQTPYKPTLALYRRILKTMMQSFSGDYEMFHRCRIETRKKILEHQAETDVVQIHNHIFLGEEAREFMEKNIIQG